jgi:hypothetical protein
MIETLCFLLIYLEMEKGLMARDNWRVNVPQSNVTEAEPCCVSSSVKYLRKEEVAKVAKQVLKLATD